MIARLRHPPGLAVCGLRDGEVRGCGHTARDVRPGDGAPAGRLAVAGSRGRGVGEAYRAGARGAAKVFALHGRPGRTAQAAAFYRLSAPVGGSHQGAPRWRPLVLFAHRPMTRYPMARDVARRSGGVGEEGFLRCGGRCPRVRDPGLPSSGGVGVRGRCEAPAAAGRHGPKRSPGPSWCGLHGGRCLKSLLSVPERRSVSACDAMRGCGDQPSPGHPLPRSRAVLAVWQNSSCCPGIPFPMKAATA